MARTITRTTRRSVAAYGARRVDAFQRAEFAVGDLSIATRCGELHAIAGRERALGFSKDRHALEAARIVAPRFAVRCHDCDPRALVDAVAAVKTRTDAAPHAQRQGAETPSAAYAFAYDALTIEELERAVTATRSPHGERS